VTAHHQHSDEKGRLMQLIDLRLNTVNGRAQAAFKARFLVHAELPPVLDNSQEMRLVLLQRVAHALDLARQIRLAESNDFYAQRVDVGDDRLADLDLAFSLLRIVTEQKILFGATAFQQLDLDPA